MAALRIPRDRVVRVEAHRGQAVDLTRATVSPRRSRSVTTATRKLRRRAGDWVRSSRTPLRKARCKSLNCKVKGSDFELALLAPSPMAERQGLGRLTVGTVLRRGGRDGRAATPWRGKLWRRTGFAPRPRRSRGVPSTTATRRLCVAARSVLNHPQDLRRSHFAPRSGRRLDDPVDRWRPSAQDLSPRSASGGRERTFHVTPATGGSASSP